MVLNEVKPIENINQNPQTFQGTSRIQKEVPYSWKMQHRKCEWQNRFELKKDNAHRKNALVNRAFQICLTYSKNIWSNWFKRLNAHLISLSYPIYLFVHILWPSLRTHLPLQMTFRDRQKYSLHWKCTTLNAWHDSKIVIVFLPGNGEAHCLPPPSLVSEISEGNCISEWFVYNSMKANLINFNLLS